MGQWVSIRAYSSTTPCALRPNYSHVLLSVQLKAIPALLTHRGRLENQKGLLLLCSLTCSITKGLGIPRSNSYLQQSLS